jgi:hypothetical protein
MGVHHGVRGERFVMNPDEQRIFATARIASFVHPETPKEVRP